MGLISQGSRWLSERVLLTLGLAVCHMGIEMKATEMLVIVIVHSDEIILRRG